MKKSAFLIAGLISFSFLEAQIHVGLFGGVAAYNGDLTEKIFPKKVTKPAVGLTVSYELQDQIIIRIGLTYAVVGGADRYSNEAELIKRNLSFETKIFEFSLEGEYYLFNLYERRYSPYVFAGVAVYRFNPYTDNQSNQKVFLKPLSTEGQGLAGYPDRKPYSLTQFAIPFGGGVKFAINDNLRIGAELGIRKLFTDYLDDVSKDYVDMNDLLAAKGQLAVDLAYRGDEVPTGSPIYPQKGAQRGSPKNDDYYYFAGIHLTYRLGEGGLSLFNGRNKYGCPTVPQ